METETEPVQEEHGPIRNLVIEVLAWFAMAVLVPARSLYPKETELRGYRFVVITILGLYLWTALSLGVGTYRFFADDTVTGLWMSVGHKFSESAAFIGILYLVFLWKYRSPSRSDSSEEAEAVPEVS